MSEAGTFIRWLFRLPGGEDLSQWRIGFERSPPAWIWVLLLAAIIVAVIWSLRGTRLSPARRVVLCVLRGALLLLLALLAAGPMLTLPRERIEPDWIVVLCDRSRSMLIPDGVVDGAAAPRDAQLAEALAKSSETWRELASKRTLLFLGFDAGVRDLETSADGSPVLGPADGTATEIGPALASALERVAARPVSGIVFFSDGRTTAAPERALLRRLSGEGVRVHVVPLGAAEASGDHAIRGVEAPQRAFVQDQIPVEVDLVRSPTVGGALRVKLIDEATGRLLDAREFDDADMGARSITLVGSAEIPGEREWRVEIEPDGRDLVSENNVRRIKLDVVDRPIRVLYVEGYPRWEYRYLKNLLVRERGIESSVMLLSADRDFAQEGNAPIARLPRTASEFAPFDLIILGDVAAGAFSQSQLEAIKEIVARRGAGLLWIAGPRFVPRTWKGSILEEMLPFKGTLEPERFDDPVTMRRTDRAARLGLLRVGDDEEHPWPAALEDPSSGWSKLEWAQRLESADLKPTAEVIAETASGDGDHASPLLVTMRYGAGESMYFATDETWRWRYGRGETIPERLWLQVIRHLARSSIGRGDRAVQLDVEPRQVEAGDPVRIELTLLDPSASATVAGSKMEVEIAPVGPAGGGAPPGGAAEVQHVELAPVAEVPGRFSTTIFPDRTGRYRVSAPGILTSEGAVDLEVSRRDLEIMRPETDHPLLAQIAHSTGGTVLAATDVTRLTGADMLPNRAVSVEQPLTQTLWDTPIALILLIVIPALEWTIRRWSRLA